jgi:hypothetical protein
MLALPSGSRREEESGCHFCLGSRRLRGSRLPPALTSAVPNWRPGDICPAGRQHAAGCRSPKPKSSVLKLTVSSSSGADAVRLVNTYAQELTKYRAEIYIRPINEALRKDKAQIDALRARGLTGTQRYEALLQRRTNLQTYGSQLANNASVLTRAEGASSFRPHMLRNGLLGGALGVLLGVALTAGVAARRRRGDRD